MNPLIIELVKMAIPMFGLDENAKTIGEKFGPKFENWVEKIAPHVDRMIAEMPQWHDAAIEVLEIKKLQIACAIAEQQKVYADIGRIATALEVLAGIPTQPAIRLTPDELARSEQDDNPTQEEMAARGDMPSA